MPAPLTLGPFADTVPLPMPGTRGPARGELITLVVALVLGKERQEVLAAPQTLWCCRLSAGHGLPKEGRNTEESSGHSVFARASFGLGTAEEGGYHPRSGEEVVGRGVKQRVTGDGNKMGTFLRNDGEGLGEGTASCYRHWRAQRARCPAGSALHC